MAEYHIAQFNIAKAKAELESETMSGFVARLDEINELGESSPGFVWRLKGDKGDAEVLRVFRDPLYVANLTLWESLESLRDFVYKTVHVELIRDREAWFHKMGESHMVLWWVPAGHIPTVEEAREKLGHIRRHGPGPEAFTFGKAFAPTKN